MELRKLIKIRGNSIYANKAKVGYAIEETFIRDQHRSITDLQKQSQEHTPVYQDPNNTMSILQMLP